MIFELFMRLAAERRLAFLIATHNPELARRADRIYRLVEGRAREITAGRIDVISTRVSFGFAAREEKG